MSEVVFSGAAFVHGEATGEIIASDVELSFWGGVDPFSGEVIDRHHPLSGQILTGKVVVIPGGRGSCSGSGVILELLFTGKGPAALVVEREDDILTLGIVIAEEVFGKSIPVVVLNPRDFRQVTTARYARVDGDCVVCCDGSVALTGQATGFSRWSGQQTRYGLCLTNLMQQSPARGQCHKGKWSVSNSRPSGVILPAPL